MKNVRDFRVGTNVPLWALACAVFACAIALAPAQAQQKGRRVTTGVAVSPKTEKAAFYSCPMHPEVKAKAQGSCPKCGMSLRPAAAQEESHSHQGEANSRRGETNSRASGMSIPDVELLDQDGRTIHFYTDLVKGRVVAVQFIFTTCTTICPPLGATFARVQKELGERAGRDVHLISVSVDPATDTPERLKAWGEKFRAGAGWTFVTGQKPQVDELLRALGALSAIPSEHSPALLVGNDASGQWTRVYGLSSPAVLVKLIDAAAAGRLEQSNDSNGKESTR
jgi:protein SCO1/2